MMCKRCRGTSMKVRRNYSHGKMSRPLKTVTCKKCGSGEIEMEPTRQKRRGFRR